MFCHENKTLLKISCTLFVIYTIYSSPAESIMNFFGISDMPPLPAKPQHLVFFGAKNEIDKQR